MGDAPIPSVVAMLICDQIIAEAGTNKKTLVGVFDNFLSPVFPVRIPRLAVYVKLADAGGNYLFKLRLVKLKDESLVIELTIEGNIKGRTLYSELVLALLPIDIPEPGKYEFQLYADDVYLHRVTMQAAILPGGPQCQPQGQ